VAALVQLGGVVFEHGRERARGGAGLGLLVLGATFLAFYFFTDSVAIGVVGGLLWFLLPWVELLTRIRRLRLPIGKVLEREAPPGHTRFPELTELTDEIEAEGFTCDPEDDVEGEEEGE
jgi:hypothetical protein